MDQILAPPRTPERPPVVNQGDGSLGIPVYVYAVVFSSLCVITGLIWDICWHLSIGRDGLLSPPHLVIYLGAVVSGLFSGYEVLRNTFTGTAAEKSRRVRVWGVFYSSLGALFCIWGAIAMLTSAPFDDWWHNTYGLDVTILSPPHTVLALGIIGVQFGAIVSVLAIKNQTEYLFGGNPAVKKKRQRVLFLLFTLSAGFLLTMWYTLLSEELGRWASHNSSYYQVAAVAFPFLLMAFGRAFSGRWTITAVTLVYSLILLLTLWIIPLFPAEPKLGPILNHLDHYNGFNFPLLLIVPAVALDYLRHRFAYWNDWKLAILLGTVFLVVFFVVQWYFGAFLLESPLARNWFFGSHYLYFGNNPDWQYRYQYAPWSAQTTGQLIKGLGIALALSILSTRIGLAWGKWMKNIQR
ncbi:hypothetical protein [Persicitalea jodogahamensis]|uniref:Uncharacterized protein n=1 Tax=Persicitalea jodogahamensis TaxID=402147 RepID=A0A8J3G7T4_9BACT|nr:hypothetical protein [Persicitalea jodogahamensis]GHB59599.1 hypothetical protein GCM10007390_11590 [Persicitalea jodogahamensis]